MLVSQLVHVFGSPAVYQPHVSRESKFWFVGNSPRKFVTGKMNKTRDPMARYFKTMPDTIGYHKGIPNLSIWDIGSRLEMQQKFKAHFPKVNPLSRPATPRLLAKVIEALDQCVTLGTHNVDFKDCYSTQLRENAWDKL
jgi:hypothetical protein